MGRPIAFFVSSPTKSKVMPLLTSFTNEYQMIPQKSITIEDDDEPFENPQIVLNKALEEIGFGRYQLILFILCGLGWAADNALFQLLAVTVQQINYEYDLRGLNGGLSTTFAYIGSACGAMIWGSISDVIGRRPAFMYTFVITAVFCITSGLFKSIHLVCISLFLMGIGFGGNLPIDGTLFLECIPPSKQSYLTLLSLWWPLGQVITSLLAWLLLPGRSCSSYECEYEDNLGWRYVSIVIGSLCLVMTLSRYLFQLQESPKYLIARGRYEEAIDVLNFLAKGNGKTLDLKPEHFHGSEEYQEATALSNTSFVARISPLFQKDLRLTTILVWLIWAFVNIGYNIFNGYLPEFLANAGTVELSVAQTYLNYVIISLVAVPGSVLGMYLTDMSIGRRGTMAAATFITGSSTFLFTFFNTNTGQLICSCITGFCQVNGCS